MQEGETTTQAVLTSLPAQETLTADQAALAAAGGDNVSTVFGAHDPSLRVCVRDLTRQFTRGGLVLALGPVDLDIADGEFLSIVGPSGCGKSTLLKIIAGLLPPSAGTVDIAHHDPQRSLSAMVPQENSVFPWKTVEKNVRFGLDAARRGTRDERNAIVSDLLRRLGLTDFAHAYPHTLSGGMKQRVAIARALAVAPEMLLMDEPFAALDAQMRTLLQNELLALWETERRTVIFITHSIEEAVILSDRVLVCSARPGRLTASFKVPFPRPRDVRLRGTPEFAALHEEIWEVVRREVDAQMSSDGAKPRTGRRWRKRSR